MSKGLHIKCYFRNKYYIITLLNIIHFLLKKQKKNGYSKLMVVFSMFYILSIGATIDFINRKIHVFLLAFTEIGGGDSHLF